MIGVWRLKDWPNQPENVNIIRSNLNTKVYQEDEMLKRLVTAGLAVWLGLTCVHNFPVVNSAPVPVDAPAAVTIPVAPPVPSATAPEAAIAPAAPIQVQNPTSAPTPQNKTTDATASRSGSAAANNSAPAITPSRAAAVKPSPGMATEMLQLMNAERAKQGLPALVLDSRLSKGAYLKSQDMGVNGYFSHTSPTYGSPFQMMKGLGITYRAAAENIARNQTVSGAHSAFMNSPGHRENILDGSFNKVGLGFHQEGKSLFVTQWFTN